jgi:hypothetical protein
MQTGKYAVINPMLSMHQLDEIDWETWLTMDCEIVSRCDLVCRLPGISVGAERECEFARSRGIPVVTPSYFECLNELFEPGPATLCKTDLDNLLRFFVFRDDNDTRAAALEGFANVAG